MTRDPVSLCESVIGYEFKDKDLLRTALTHPSFSADLAPANERLEFLGDAVLGFVVCHHLYRTFDDLTEGQLTQIKSALVSATTLARVVHNLGLDRFIQLGKGLTSGPPLSRKVLGALFESVLGAFFLDAGLDRARAFVLRSLEDELQRILDRRHDLNYKSMLQHYAQANLRITPHYTVASESGPDHDKIFEIVVSIKDEVLGRGSAPSKKEAQQHAAKQAYLALHPPDA